MIRHLKCLVKVPLTLVVVLLVFLATALIMVLHVPVAVAAMAGCIDGTKTIEHMMDATEKVLAWWKAL